MTTPRIRETAAASAHLVAFGIAGSIVVTVLSVIATTGIALIPVLGVGLLLIALFAVLLAAVARFEDARVAGLFGYPVPERPVRRSSRNGFWRLPHTLWLQLADGRHWLGMLHFLIITVLGGVAVWALRSVANAVAAIISAIAQPTERAGVPFSTLELPGWAAALMNAALIVGLLFALWGLARAHRGISRMLLPSRTPELVAAAATATRRRDDAMQAATVERTRIERDLHDGVQPRLVSIGMTLGLAKTKLADDPESAGALIDEAHASTKEAITELRQLARGFRPAVLEDRGLDAALSALAARSPIPVTLDVRLSERCSDAAESAMYFAVAEALTNAAKHSGAAECRVTILTRPGGMLWARMEDDGLGGAHITPGGGLDGMHRRVQAAGGTVSVTSPAGGPTTIEVSLPCAS